MAALAPMPSPRDRIAMVVTNGVRASVRRASFRLRIRSARGSRLSATWTPAPALPFATGYGFGATPGWLERRHSHAEHAEDAEYAETTKPLFVGFLARQSLAPRSTKTKGFGVSA